MRKTGWREPLAQVMIGISMGEDIYYGVVSSYVEGRGRVDAEDEGGGHRGFGLHAVEIIIIKARIHEIQLDRTRHARILRAGMIAMRG